MPLKEAVEKTETDGKDGDDGKVKYVTVHYSRTARPRLDFYSNLTLLKKKIKKTLKEILMVLTLIMGIVWVVMEIVLVLVGLYG